jgi:hypothetical protein
MDKHAIWPFLKQFAINKMIWPFGHFGPFYTLLKVVSFKAYFGKISTKHTAFHVIPKFI